MRKIVKEKHYFVLTNLSGSYFLANVDPINYIPSFTNDITQAKNFNDNGDAYCFAHNNHLVEFKYPIEICEEVSIIE